jgi:HD-GYP domain-containing protein (c-di-GMP phosphodiesterase class II)
MPLWTLWDKTQPPASAVIKEHQATPGTASGELPTSLDESLAWLVESHDAQPTYDPAVAKLSRNNGVVTLDPNDIRTGTRVWGWSVVPLTEAELQDAARQAALQSEQVAVGTIAQAWLDDEEPISATDVARVARFIAIRDGLDAQGL